MKALFHTVLSSMQFSINFILQLQRLYISYWRYWTCFIQVCCKEVQVLYARMQTVSFI